MGEEKKALTVKMSRVVIDLIKDEKLLDHFLHEAALGELGQKVREIDEAFHSDWENQKAFQQNLVKKDQEIRAKLIDDMIGFFDFPPGRISLKKYKAWLRRMNAGAYDKSEVRYWEARLDEAFPRDAARDRVHEWEGVWLWD